MASVNELLRDAAISHAVDLAHYSNGVVRRIIGLLNRADADLFAQLTEALDRLPAESFTVDRLERLLKSVRELNAEAYRQVERELTKELRDFAAYEAGYQLKLFEATIPAQVQVAVGVATVNPTQIYSAALSRPFQGRLLREWASSIEAGRMTRIRDAIRMGYVEGQTADQIIRRLRGTRAKGYADGIIEIDRRHAAAVVQTALGHMANFARERVYDENKGLIKAIEWVSTIDTKTSDQCRIRDKKHYHPETHKPIGHSIPWGAGPGQLHWNCRSTSVPITKSWRELGIDIDEIDPSTRASMDGQVPAETTYADWLQRQSAARQDQVLGPTRGKLMREGGLTMDRFYNEKGKFLSLDELRQRDAAAFERAGLD